MTPDPSQIPAGPPLAEEARYADPHDDPAYQEYVEAAAERCRCDYDRPCEGVLCGGLCDERRHEFYEANEDSA